MNLLYNYPIDFNHHILTVYGLSFHIPDYIQYNYFAIDKHGIAYVYKDKPYIDGEIWNIVSTPENFHKVGIVGDIGNWKSTLINLRWLGINHLHININQITNNIIHRLLFKFGVKMKKLLIGLFCIAMLSSNIASAGISTDGLSREQVAQIELQKAQMKLDSLSSSNTNDITQPVEEIVSKLTDINITEEQFDNFSSYGTKLGKVITGFAVEIGVTITDFLATPWGIFAALMLIWHLFGGDISLIMLSIGSTIVFMPIWVKLAKTGLYEKVLVTGKDKQPILDKDGNPLFNEVFSMSRWNDSVGGALVVSFMMYMFLQIVISLNM